MNIKQTRTFVKLEVSKRTYNEINILLKEAGYSHAFIEDNGEILIDMHGIVLQNMQPTAFELGKVLCKREKYFNKHK